MTIVATNLTKKYGNVQVLSAASFEVAKGEIVGLLGTNGAGKTTTMRILAGYTPATDGTATIAGYDVTAQSLAARSRVGYLPEVPPLYPQLTVRQFLRFVAQIRGVDARDEGKAIDRTIANCGLVGKEKVPISNLSKGYRQRVGLAQAIVHSPPVLILDEPTVGLDPLQIIEIRSLIRELSVDRAILFSSHLLAEVSELCDRVTILDRGRVIASDRPADLQARLTHSTVYRLVVGGVGDEYCTKVRAILSAIDGFEAIEVAADDVHENRLLITLTTNDDRDLGSEAIAKLVSGDIPVYESYRDRINLETAFVNLLRGKNNEDSGEDSSD
jgi:ABC-2 type transport system ATP-binding protein